MSDFQSLKCAICDQVCDWRNVDEFRLKPAGMHMCNGCGFITYPNLCLDTKKVSQHYVHEYRGAPTVHNMYSCERKTHYHAEFLQSLFEEWHKAGKHPPRVYEIGAAFG